MLVCGKRARRELPRVSQIFTAGFLSTWRHPNPSRFAEADTARRLVCLRGIRSAASSASLAT